jgi:hypothetical protein
LNSVAYRSWKERSCTVSAIGFQEPRILRAEQFFQEAHHDPHRLRFEPLGKRHGVEAKLDMNVKVKRAKCRVHHGVIGKKADAVAGLDHHPVADRSIAVMRHGSPPEQIVPPPPTRPSPNKFRNR